MSNVSFNPHHTKFCKVADTQEIYPHKHSYQYYIPSETIASDDNNGTTCMLSNSIILQFLLVSNVYFEICTNLKSK